jgi:hypothetical protein
MQQQSKTHRREEWDYDQYPDRQRYRTEQKNYQLKSLPSNVLSLNVSFCMDTHLTPIPTLAGGSFVATSN